MAVEKVTGPIPDCAERLGLSEVQLSMWNQNSVLRLHVDEVCFCLEEIATYGYGSFLRQ